MVVPQKIASNVWCWREAGRRDRDRKEQLLTSLLKLHFALTTQQGPNECVLIDVYSYTERDSETVFVLLNGVKGNINCRAEVNAYVLGYSG